LGPSTAELASESGDLRQISVDAIRPNRYQPRQAVDDRAIADLAASLGISGLLQPIVLRPSTGGTYELIAGERRWRAARSLGWKTIGSVIREVDDRTLLTLALVENLQRDALSAIDEAKGYQRLIEDFNATQSEIGQLVGRDRSTIANSLRLLRLPKLVRGMVHRRELDMGHARALLQLDEPAKIERLARAVVEHGLSVRETEHRARGSGGTQRRARAGKTGRKLSPEARRVEDALRRYLGTDVSVVERGRGGGRLAVHFYSNDDLTRILELMMGGSFDG
jgi:ParB family chromosome partitioning protein